MNAVLTTVLSSEGTVPQVIAALVSVPAEDRPRPVAIFVPTVLEDHR